MKRKFKCLFVFFFFMAMGIGVVADDPAALELPAQTWYKNDAETANSLSFWTKPAPLEYTINFLGLSEDKKKTGKKSIKLDITLKGEHYCYFKIPVNCRLKPGESYYASGNLLVEQFPFRGRNKIGLGTNIVTWYGKGRKENTSGTYSFGDLSRPAKDWVYMESGELSRKATAGALSVGLPTDAIDVEYVYLDIMGLFDNDRVVVYIDDVVIANKPKNPEKAVDLAEAKKYPILKEVFPFGLYGSSGGDREADAAGAFKEKWPDALWRDLPNWKSRYINTVIGECPELYADSDIGKFDRLAAALKIFEKNHMYLVPPAYLMRCYRSELSAESCEKTIREQIPRFKDSKALLAWMINDEPDGEGSALEDYLWGKRVIGAIDSKHPVITGGNSYSYPWARNRPVSLFDWYYLRKNFYAPWSVAGITAAIYRDSIGPVWYIAPAFHTITGEYTRPTPAELSLMSYAAIANGAKGLFFYSWRERPLLIWMAGSGIVDTIGSDTPLWNEVRELGRQLTAVGPLLLKTKVEQNIRLKIQADPIVITWKEEIPAIAANLLSEEGADVNYIIAYNNDPKQQRKGKIQLPTNIVESRSLYDLYSLNKVQMDKDNEGRTLNLELGPGEGRIYLLAKDADYNLRRDQIMANRINNEKEAVKYELYQAWLAGVASPALVKSYRDADTLSALQAVRKTLSGEIAGNAKYAGIGANLDRIQKNLSELNGLYEQKVAALESPVSQPSEYPKRDFFASDPATRAYLDAFLELGHLYFRQRNLYMTGKYGEIESDVAQLDTWVKDLLETAKKALSGKPPVVPLKTDLAGIRTMCDRLDSMWAKKGKIELDPEEMLRNKETNAGLYPYSPDTESSPEALPATIKGVKIATKAHK